MTRMPTPALGQSRDPAARPSPPGPQAPPTAASGSQRVDEDDRSSVSFAPSGGSDRGARAWSDPPGRARESHALVPVGPGVPGALLLGGRAGIAAVTTFPIVGARIHPPMLRADVLSRERLNGWLDQAAEGRLALIVAEAGFGKTTLLADWARHTSRLTAWYRLERDDRDWLTFARHLVASGRELDGAFASATFDLLMQLGPGGPTRDDIMASLAQDIAAFGAASSQGFTLIFDDYHEVDGSDEVVPTVRALLDLTGPGFSIVIASRSVPKLPLSRLRARHAVSRLTGDSLCFEPDEADRLFRDAYGLPLDREVVGDLVERTEGWAALLSLVRTSLEGRSEESARGLVLDLTGAGGDMYDYLAEEVLDHLPSALSDFLVRASLLDDLHPEASALLADVTPVEAQSLIATAEELALAVRPDPGTNHRFVPLVREFLLARLATVLDADAIREAHRRLGEAFDGRDWRISATHFRRAGDAERARHVVTAALEEILATGQYRAADDLLSDNVGDVVVRGVLRSRLLLQVGATLEAVELSGRTFAAAEIETHSHLALAAQNAASIAFAVHHYDDALKYAQRSAMTTDGGDARDVAEAYSALLGASVDANLPAVARQFERMLARQIDRGQTHYAAITSLNLAQVLVWLDRLDEALRLAADADHRLGKSSRGYEGVSVRLVQAQAKAHAGDWPTAEPLLRIALSTDHPAGEEEAALEAASIAAWFGPYDYPDEILERVDRRRLPSSWALHWRALDLWLVVGLPAEAAALEETSGDPPASAEAGAAFRWHVARARSFLRSGDGGAFGHELDRVERVAAAQASPAQRRIAAVLRALGDGPIAVSRLLGGWDSLGNPLLGIFAAELSQHLGTYSDSALATVARAAADCPHRWRRPLRSLLGRPGPNGDRAASILEQIGEWSDIRLLREYSRWSQKSTRSLGITLAQRLAPRVMVDDLGPASITVGDRPISGDDVRRRVLGLLMFLASQPNGSATPDQVLEAMWPGLDPGQGLNSIHQTVYFLRRVIDPDYRTGVSVDYIRFNSELMWLDKSLVDCRSWLCRRLFGRRPETQQVVEDVLEQYRGQFAPDFAYEDWASGYRDSLHAAFLSMIERAVTGKIGSADPRWRLWVAQRALAIDPEADGIEALVIRLYRELDSPVAAAEQYAHYAAVMRDDLGIEPPPIELV